MSKLAKNVCDAIDIIVQKRISDLNFDKTIIGIILSIENAETGEYKVQYQDSVITAYEATGGSVSYAVGTPVYVSIPSNDFTKRKIITRTVTSEEDRILSAYINDASKKIPTPTSAVTYSTTTENSIEGAAATADVVVTWDAVTTYEDGTPANIGGYLVEIIGSAVQPVFVGPEETSTIFESLPLNTTYEIKVIPVSIHGYLGETVQAPIITATVNDVPDVSGLVGDSIVSGTIRAVWDPLVRPDLLGYLVQYRISNDLYDPSGSPETGGWGAWSGDIDGDSIIPWANGQKVITNIASGGSLKWGQFRVKGYVYGGYSSPNWVESNSFKIAAVSAFEDEALNDEIARLVGAVDKVEFVDGQGLVVADGFMAFTSSSDPNNAVVLDHDGLRGYIDTTKVFDLNPATGLEITDAKIVLTSTTTPSKKITLDPSGSPYIARFEGGAIYAERVDENGTARQTVLAGQVITHSVVVATFNTSNEGKASADFVVDSVVSNAALTVQAAIDSLPGTGGTVTLLEGYYYFSTSVTVPSNILIQGIGGKAATSIFLRNGCINGGFYLNQKSGVIFRDLWLQNDFDVSAQIGIKIRESSNITIENCQMLGSGVNACVDVLDCYSINLINSKFEGSPFWYELTYPIVKFDMAAPLVDFGSSFILGCVFSDTVLMANFIDLTISECFFDDSRIDLAQYTYAKNNYVVRSNSFVLDEGLNPGVDIYAIINDASGTMIMGNSFIGWPGEEILDTGVGTVIIGNSHQPYISQSYWNSLLEDTNFTTGFVNRTDSILSYSDVSGLFTIAPAAGTFVIYSRGQKFTISNTQSIAIPNTVGEINFVYFDENGIIRTSTTPWDITGDKVPIATVHIGIAAVGVVADERHGANRNGAWHKWAHETIGTRYENGLAGTFDNTTLSIGAGSIHDEDLEFIIDTQTTCRLYYRNAATTKMQFDYSPVTTPYKTNAGALRYDNAGSLTDVSNNKYTNEWVYATNIADAPIAVIIGQAQHNTLALARAEALPHIPMSVAEWKLLYGVTYQQTSGGIVYTEARDYRAVSAGPAINASGPTVVDHGALVGLEDDDHPQYIKHSLATAANDFLVASGVGVFVKKTLAEIKTLLGLGTAAYTAATDYAAATHASRHDAGGADALAIDAAAGTGSLRTLGTGSTNAAAGNHNHSGVYATSAHSHNISFSDATYGSGWTTTTGWYNVGYTSPDTLNRVWLRGVCQHASGVGQTIFTLPVGSRPAQKQAIGVVCYDPANGSRTGYVVVNTNGTVVFTQGNSGWVMLDGHSFYLG